MHYIKLQKSSVPGENVPPYIVHNARSEEENNKVKSGYEKKLNAFAKKAFGSNESELAKAFISLAEGEAIYKVYDGKDKSLKESDKNRRYQDRQYPDRAES